MQSHRLVALAILAVGLAAPGAARAQAPIVLTFDAAVPGGSETHFFIPFTVPAGVVEIEVRHDDLSPDDILDWGLEDASGFRGWGGGNTEPAVVGVDRASRSYVPGPIAAGAWRVVVGKAKLVSANPGYHVEVEMRFSGTLAAQPTRAPYVDPAPLRSTAAWYAGDFHVHSRESGDASATLDQIGTLAVARELDFVTISDHNTHTANDFFADVQGRFPTLLFVPSVEFTTYAGHASVPGALTWVNHRIGVEGATIEDAVAAYHAQGAVFSINHPEYDLGDLCIGCAFRHPIAPESIDAIEIMTTSLPVVQALFLDPTIARWDALCDSGAHVAALGGSDDHRAGMGTGTLDSTIGGPTTMVYAASLSTPAILEGIRSGRTSVRIRGPESPKVILDATSPLDGDTVHARATTLTTDVEGGAGDTLLYFRDGVQEGDAVVITSDSFHHELRVVAPPSGESRYRAEVYDMMGRVTVTSHVYITRTGAPTASGCSCRVGPRSSSGGGLGLVAILALGFAVARRAQARWSRSDATRARA